MANISKENYIKDEHLKEHIEDYWQQRAKSFSSLRQKELNSDKYQKWLDEISSHLSNTKLKILDIGCGAGFFTIMLSRLGHDVTGIDLSKNMIDEANKLGKDENVKFMVMDAENLDFEDETFDVIVSRNLTWTLPHLEDAYKEWMRVLKKEGIMLNYDGEHAKNHHEHLPVHQDLNDELVKKCHTIYNSLETSLFNRPEYDQKLFNDMNYSCEIDKTVGRRIYKEKDDFYISVPLFLVKVKKDGY